MDGTWKSAVCSPRVPCGLEYALDSRQFLRGGMPAVSVVLFDQAVWVVLIKPTSWDRHGLKPWLEAAKKRLHHNVLAITLANKLARIAWSVLAHGRTFEASKIQAA
jgi:hypothetical protein